MESWPWLSTAQFLTLDRAVDSLNSLVLTTMTILVGNDSIPLLIHGHGVANLACSLWL